MLIIIVLLIFLEIEYSFLSMSILIIFAGLILDVIAILRLAKACPEYLNLLLSNELLDSLQAILDGIRLHLPHSLLKLIFIGLLHPIVS